MPGSCGINPCYRKDLTRLSRVVPPSFLVLGTGEGNSSSLDNTVFGTVSQTVSPIIALRRRSSVWYTTIVFFLTSDSFSYLTVLTCLSMQIRPAYLTPYSKDLRHICAVYCRLPSASSANLNEAMSYSSYLVVVLRCTPDLCVRRVVG